jgi:hypothetical protein
MMETCGSGGCESIAPSEGAAGATTGAADDMVAKEAAVKKRVVDVVDVEKAAVVKATTEKATADRTAADKTGVDKASVDKAAAYKAAADRATTDKAITDERAAEEGDAMNTVVAGVAQKSIAESANTDPTLAPVAGSKRAATLSDSTPPRSSFVVLGSSGTLSYSDACFSFPFHLSYV